VGAASAQAGAAQPATSAEAAITVHLLSDRTFTAAIDPRTDSVLLWLCFQREGVEILRPIHWDRVTWAEVAGENLPGEEFQRLVAQLRQEIPAQPVTPPTQTEIVIIGEPEVEPPTPAAGTATPQGRVVSLVIDASPACWDGNVEPDGLLVHVYPLGADGATVPVRGTLNVDLKLQQRSIDMLHEPFIDAGHWAETVQTTDFGPMGAVYRLRFQRIHPEFEDRVMSPGSVHACLSVPGQGTFEASTYIGSIRPFNPARDHLQSITRHGYFSGYRYFPNERTDDGRR
jgi:hypothetical protein